MTTPANQTYWVKILGKHATRFETLTHSKNMTHSILKQRIPVSRHFTLYGQYKLVLSHWGKTRVRSTFTFQILVWVFSHLWFHKSKILIIIILSYFHSLFKNLQNFMLFIIYFEKLWFFTVPCYRNCCKNHKNIGIW